MTETKVKLSSTAAAGILDIAVKKSEMGGEVSAPHPLCRIFVCYPRGRGSLTGPKTLQLQAVSRATPQRKIKTVPRIDINDRPKADPATAASREGRREKSSNRIQSDTGRIGEESLKVVGTRFVPGGDGELRLYPLGSSDTASVSGGGGSIRSFIMFRGVRHIPNVAISPVVV